MTTTQLLTCLRCGHKWLPRVPDPATCPKCKAYEWRTPRKETKP